MSLVSVCLSVTLVYCRQTVGWIKMKLVRVEVGLGPSYIVLDGDLAPPLWKGLSPQFSAHVCCRQTAGWIKVPLGMEVGFGLGDIVLDETPPPKKKGGGTGHSTPNFGPCLLWPNGWMDQDETWHGGRPRPRPNCVRWIPSSSHRKGHSSPIFGLCLLWPNGRQSQLLLSSVGS